MRAAALAALLLALPAPAAAQIAAIRCHFVFDWQQIEAILKVELKEFALKKAQESNNGLLRVGGAYLGRKHEKRMEARRELGLVSAEEQTYDSLQDSLREVRNAGRGAKANFIKARADTKRTIQRTINAYDREKARGFPTMLSYANDKFYQMSMGIKRPPTECDSVEEMENSVDDLFLKPGEGDIPSLKLKRLNEIDAARMKKRTLAALGAFGSALSGQYRLRQIMADQKDLAERFARHRQQQAEAAAAAAEAAAGAESEEEGGDNAEGGEGGEGGGAPAATQTATAETKEPTEGGKPTPGVGRAILKQLTAGKPEDQENVHMDLVFAARALLLRARIERVHSEHAMVLLNMDLQKAISILPAELPDRSKEEEAEEAASG